MREKSDSVNLVVTYGWSGLAVGLLLLGRWTPDRLFADATLSDLFWVVKIGALLVIALVAALPNRLARDRRTPFVGLFIVLMGYVFASYLWNPSTLPYADGKLADLAFNFALIVAVAAGLSREPMRNAFWVMLIAALGLMAVIGVVTLPSAVATADQGRLSVLGGGPNIFGRNMGLLFIACLYFGLNNARFRIVCAGLAGAALIGLIGSGSRGGLAAFLVGVLALFALDPASRRFVLTRPLIILAFFAVGGAALLVADVGIIAEIGTERIVEQTLEGGYLSMRDILFQWAWDFWLEAPAFGNGLGSFALVTPLEYPHNILMEFLCETGIVGLLLFLALFLSSTARQFVSANPERGLLLAVVALLFVAAQASGDFVDSRLLFLFLLYPVTVAAASRVRVTFRPVSGEPWRLGRPR